MYYKQNKDGLMEVKINKKEYLIGMKDRLKDDVKPYLDLCHKYANKNKGIIGFWGMIRLVMPVVNAVAQVVYPKFKKNSWLCSSNVLKDLEVPYPFIAWKVFRNCLIHTDEMVGVIDDKNEQYAGWEITIGGGHQIKELMVSIDVEKLFFDLEDYIQIKFDKLKNNEEEIKLRVVKFNNKQLLKNNELAKEYKRLFGTKS